MLEINLMEAIVKRLELVAERLERQLVAQSPAVVAPPSLPVTQSAVPQPSAPPSSSVDVSASWDQVLATHLPPLAAITSSLNDDSLTTAFTSFKNAFSSISFVIKASQKAIGPDATAMQSLVAPIGQEITSLMSMADKGRRLASFNHIKVLSECVQVLQWVMFSPGPSSPLAPPPQLAIDTQQAAEFFTNKILQEWRAKDDRHVSWVKAVKELMTGTGRKPQLYSFHIFLHHD